MTAVMAEPAAFSGEASKALGTELGESPKLTQVRDAGAAAARQLSWPDSYAERPWKYTNVRELSLEAYRPALAGDAGSNTIRSCPVSGEHAAAIAFANGTAVFTEPSPDGLTLVPFEALEGKALATVEEHYGNVVPAERSRFTALHYAFQRGGVLVQAAPNSEFAEPIRIVRRYSGQQFAAPHTLIVTGANSRVNVVEELFSDESDVLAVPVVEVVPGPGAEVRYTVVHRWGSKTRVVSEQRMVGARDSAFISLSLVNGGRTVKSHLESSLIERGSSSELYGLCAGNDAQHVDFYTLQDHIGPDTRSDLLFKAALKDRSRAIYYGITRVGLGAQNADANQSNRNLLLSPDARADSDPVLEILTSNIIRCSHGATAGPVDREQLFYLQSRAIPYPAAESLLVRAFLGEVLARVPNEALRDELAEAVNAKLE